MPKSCYIRVIVPIYRPTLTGRDLISFKHNLQILGHYPTALLAPEGMDISAIEALAPKTEVVRVSKDWLGERGIAGYNNMMLSKQFYTLFANCEYILICQTDAWIFRDTLTQWCDKGYDYIGAPWPKKRRYSLPIVRLFLWLRRKFFRRKGELMRQDYFNKVGNGGLSLRKVDSFIAACDKYKAQADHFKRHNDMLHNEDWFWALIPQTFRYPEFVEALGFSFDVNPKLCYALNGKRLPFGCHGWWKKKNIKFWSPIIEQKEQ